MTSTDRKRLTTPFSSDQLDAVTRHAEATRALGLELGSCRELAQAVRNDLSRVSPFGISWWMPATPSKRRILISDHLFSCVKGIERNLVEAALHLLEFKDYCAQDSDRYANSVRRVEGVLIKAPPSVSSPFEELVPAIAEMNAAGVARAVGSALDCLAATMIAVLGLPKPIVSASFQQVRRDLSPNKAALPIDIEFLIDSAGPSGWLDWTLEYRNMLVHRGRRIDLGSVDRRSTEIFGPDNKIVPRAKRTTFLPANPGRSDVECFRTGDVNDLVLNEDWLATVSGILRSGVQVTENICADLAKTWANRKATHTSVVQPIMEQWPKVRPNAPATFRGYRPRLQPLEPTSAVAHPEIELRFRSAALTDDLRSVWDSLPD